MTNDAGTQGWVLHCHGRDFGPLDEDELRGYFRAGMVRSVDRITCPGDATPRAAAEVALELGEAVPAGPPPPALPVAASSGAASTPVPPPDNVPQAGHAPDERALQAMAALRVQLAAASPGATAPPRSRNTVLALLAVLALVASTWAVLEMRKAREREATVRDPRAQVRAEYNRTYDRADALMQAEDWRGLAGFARTWATGQPRSFEAWRFLAIAHAKLREWPAAIAADRKAVALEPSDRDARLQLADDLSLSRAEGPEAERIYEQLYIEDSADPHMLNNYAIVLGRARQHVRAVVLLERAVRLDPAYKLAWRNLGNQYRALGQKDKAAEAFARAEE